MQAAACGETRKRNREQEGATFMTRNAELAKRHAYRVTLVPSDDDFAPPEKEIDICVIADDVFITVFEGSEDDLKEGRKRVYEVPGINIEALIKALCAFSDQAQAIRMVREPVR